MSVWHQPVSQGAPDGGEYSWGPGPTPPGLEDDPPSESGRYRGTTPPVSADGLQALARELAERQDRQS